MEKWPSEDGRSCTCLDQKKPKIRIPWKRQKCHGYDKTQEYHIKPYMYTKYDDLKAEPTNDQTDRLISNALSTYLMGQNLHNRTRPRFHNYECPCHIWKWSKMACGRECANGDFQCAKLENVAKIIFPAYDKTLNLSWVTYLALHLYQIWCL